MIFGTHNSMTYQNPKCFLLRPFKKFAQCQVKTIEEQYDCGARYFDLRIRFRKGKPYFCHGLVEYNGDIDNVLVTLVEKAKTDGSIIYIRIMFENIFNKGNEDEFLTYVDYLRNKFNSDVIKFCIKKKYPHTEYLSTFDKKYKELLHIIMNAKEFFATPKGLATEQISKLCNWSYGDDVIAVVDFL